MSTVWTPEKIENYKRASEYTAFHRKLSVLAEPYLDENWTLADIGCGPGLIDFWIAPMVAGIDAIDIDSVAIDSLTTRVEEIFWTNRNVAEKIKPRIASIDELEGEKWDVVMLGFFGVNEDVLRKALSLANRRAIIFMHGRRGQAGPFETLDDGGKFTAPEMDAFLKKNNFTFKKTVMEMQFGQPFKSIENIQSFLAEYGTSGGRGLKCVDIGDGDFTDDEVIKRVTSVEERIIKTKRFDCPFYLPKSVSVALFIILIGKGEK